MSCQAAFRARWPGLTHPHVRALAWLLDAPDLLDVAHPLWAGRIATLGHPDAATAAWLHALDHDPAPLQAALGVRPYTRLGLYAEQLMAFYFAAQGQLLAHGLQVRAARNDTVGEFDFLLDAGAGAARHLELATKFYLLEGVAPDQLDALVGPNLADTLGRKMRKITGQQLALGQHPAAQAVLPWPVVSAQALVKGWLFYPRGTVPGLGGLATDQCHGWWCAQEELAQLPGDRFVVLPRLQWLAPLRTADADLILDGQALQASLAERFAQSERPVLVAAVEPAQNAWHETERVFIVPSSWRDRAAAARQRNA